MVGIFPRCKLVKTVEAFTAPVRAGSLLGFSGQKVPLSCRDPSRTIPDLCSPYSSSVTISSLMVSSSRGYELSGDIRLPNDANLPPAKSWRRSWPEPDPSGEESSILRRTKSDFNISTPYQCSSRRTLLPIYSLESNESNSFVWNQDKLSDSICFLLYTNIRQIERKLITKVNSEMFFLSISVISKILIHQKIFRWS